MADNKGPYFTPSQMSRFILPYLTDWVEFVHSQGAAAILHTDGNILPCAKEIASCGLDAIQGVDPTAGVTLQAMREAVGSRVALCGNLDTGLMASGSVCDIVDEARRLAGDASRYGPVVVGCSNAVVCETPAQSYRAFLSAVR